ncbi:hypothetical protein ACLOJK_026339 [Asimina triloba]
MNGFRSPVIADREDDGEDELVSNGCGSSWKRRLPRWVDLITSIVVCSTHHFDVVGFRLSATLLRFAAADGSVG